GRPGPSAGGLAAAGARARVRLPGRVAALVVTSARPDRIARRLGADVLTLTEDSTLTAWLPASRSVHELETTVEGHAAGMGPAVGGADGGRSLRRPRAGRGRGER